MGEICLRFNKSFIRIEIYTKRKSKSQKVRILKFKKKFFHRIHFFFIKKLIPFQIKTNKLLFFADDYARFLNYAPVNLLEEKYHAYIKEKLN